MQEQLDLGTVRARLAGQSGRRFWRSLDELAENPGFDEFLKREFPRQSNGWLGPVSRREFLKTMGAGLALAGLTSCGTAPAERIIPYVNKPEELVPGKPLFYATAMTLGGYATGILVESHEGRPTKVEGNPSHPASLGAADVFSQASVLSVYDPDRSQAVLNLSRPSTYQRFVTTLQTRMNALTSSNGAGLRVLTEVTTSPTLTAQMTSLLSTYSGARWTQYDPVGRTTLAEATQAVLGQNASLYYRFDQATRVLSLDSDFLYATPGTLRYARDFMSSSRCRGRSGRNEPAVRGRKLIEQHWRDRRPSRARTCFRHGCTGTVAGKRPRCRRRWSSSSACDRSCRLAQRCCQRSAKRCRFKHYPRGGSPAGIGARAGPCDE